MALTKLNSASVIDRLPVGSVLQTVSNTFTGIDSFTNETTDSGLSCAITPRKSNSILMITASLYYSITGNAAFAFITDSSNNMIQQPPASSSRARAHFGTHYGSSSFMTYNTIRSSHTVFTTHSGTSAQTFKVRVTSNATSTVFYINRNVYNIDRFEDSVGISTMFIQEIKQ